MRTTMDMRNARVALGVLAMGASILMACGTATGTNPAGGGPAATVASRDVAGVGAVLVDGQGNTLYFTDQDGSGMSRCAAECATVWRPLTVPSGSMPQAGAGVTGALATLTRDDGTLQVTHEGRPLYLFTLDGGPGQTKGNGVSDSFAGASFTWHAATATGAASAPPTSAGPSGSMGPYSKDY